MTLCPLSSHQSSLTVFQGFWLTLYFLRGHHWAYEWLLEATLSKTKVLRRYLSNLLVLHNNFVPMSMTPFQYEEVVVYENLLLSEISQQFPVLKLMNDINLYYVCWKLSLFSMNSIFFKSLKSFSMDLQWTIFAFNGITWKEGLKSRGYTYYRIFLGYSQFSFHFFAR